MKRHHIQVTRTARYYTLGPSRGSVRSLWFLCHGYRQLARDLLHSFRHLDDGSRLLVAPEGLSRFYLDNRQPFHGTDVAVGASWMTREDRGAEIDDYVRFLDHVDVAVSTGAVVSGPRIVLGFSQGTATVSRWVATGAVTCDRLILWGGGLPGDLDVGGGNGKLADVAVTLVTGSRDALAPPARIETVSRRLREAGIAHDTVVFDGGHRIDTATLLDLAARFEAA